MSGRASLPLSLLRPPLPPPRRHGEMKPILMAVDDQAQGLELVRRELLKRYADDYEVAGEASAEAALERLEALRAASAEVAILFVAERLAGMGATGLLARGHELPPWGWRVVVLPWGTRAQ